MKRTLCRVLSILGAGIALATVPLLALGFAQPKGRPIAPANIAPKAPRQAIPNERATPVQQGRIDPQLPADLSKGGIESPTKKLLAGQTTPSTSPPATDFINPKVQPGHVRWHNTFAVACAAARRSGKPVLLFQMMGKLDERFC